MNNSKINSNKKISGETVLPRRSFTIPLTHVSESTNTQQLFIKDNKTNRFLINKNFDFTPENIILPEFNGISIFN